MGQLFLLRHGESIWNRDDRFAGWADIPLTETGRAEMRAAGEHLRGVRLDRVFTSALERTRESARIVVAASENEGVEIVSTMELNERYYGRLMGRNRAETEAEFGRAQVKLWRRSWDVRPPGGESLEDAASRILPYFAQTVLPFAAQGENVLVSGHGNTLRVLMMRLGDLTSEEVVGSEIATGGLYRYDIGPNGDVTAKVEIPTKG